MLNPEDFRRQLSEVLAAKQKAEVEAATAARLRQQQETAQARERTKQQQIVAEAEQKQRNQAVLELDTQLPIRQYLEVLRDQVAYGHLIRRWGPEDGKIAYAFFYGATEFRSIVVKTESHGTGGSKGIQPWTKEFYGLRLIRNAFGVVLRFNGMTYIADEQIANSNRFPYKKNINPLTWNLSKYWVDVTSPEGLQQFAQALTDFYVGLKSGK